MITAWLVLSGRWDVFSEGKDLAFFLSAFIAGVETSLLCFILILILS